MWSSETYVSNNGLKKDILSWNEALWIFSILWYLWIGHAWKPISENSICTVANVINDISQDGTGIGFNSFRGNLWWSRCNAIRTTRYNLLNCIPLYLWDVFNPKYKLANIFFLLVSILQCIPSISLTNGLPSSLPSLLTIIGAEAVHMGILEHKRRKSDKEMNSRKVVCWDTNTHEWKERMWKEICVCFGNW